MNELLGDTPEAPCYGLDKDKTPYRSAPHSWRPLRVNADFATSGGASPTIEVCDSCGGMRAVVANA